MSTLEIHDLDGQPTLSFECGTLPVDDAIRDTDHEPNGYFWESIAHYLHPELDDTIDYDPEADMFAAHGDTSDLKKLATTLEPLTQDPAAITDVVERATADDHEFDD